MLPELVVASANPDKVKEISEVLDGLVTLIPRPEELPEVVEDGDTLEDNARLKAKAILEATGIAALSDDTGLSVDALGGDPGVHSARYSSESASYYDNVEKLLKNLEGIPPRLRTARFQTVAMVCYPDGTEVIATGVVEGTIAESRKGSEGFGYDPVFIPYEGRGLSFAEMGEEKHRISHRGRALRNLVEMLSS
ncbi:MAG TPA: RdgB/HAM1 family non-canonical purine NTP pyrophosphatase [Acidimicrobiales bacterium]|nr:RdgB/HAM1 family non-canonical purine NTP pyrophosphatase [Acidimicrobiales bacterium]|tara:strand:+ start:1583 stop:2164 length:582 start_codon:yes stop_codon:yes gene_type:complete